jgi:hypothetical protein
MAVAPPKAMQAKKAKKEEQWMKKKNAELQQAKRDNVRLSVEFASIQAVALERADNKDAELQRVKRDNERLAAALEGKEAELRRVKRDSERLAAAPEWKEAELQRVKRDNERLVGALECIMQAALVGDKGLSDGDFHSEIQAVEQMRGAAGQIALRAKASEVGVRQVEKIDGAWKPVRLEVLRMRVLDRLRGLRWRGLCSHAGSCSGRKRLLSKTKENNSSSSSATTNEQSAKCRKGEGQ